MHILSTRAALGAVVSGLLVLSACSNSGSTNGMPSSASASQPMSRFGSDKAAAPLSGQYKGTVKDTSSGTGDAKASFAAYQSGLGGTLTVKYVTSGTESTASVGLIANGSSVNGTTVMLEAGSYCTFSDTATYKAKTRTLSGSYTAVYGCTGESGTFTLKHQCYYTGSGSESADIRPDAGPKPC